MVDGKFTKVEGTDRDLPADLVLLAMGFTGPERGAVARAARRRVRRARQRRPRRRVRLDVSRACSSPATSGRGQSLIVWAIAEGRSCAAAVDRYLMGDSQLPTPVLSTTRPLV